MKKLNKTALIRTRFYGRIDTRKIKKIGIVVGSITLIGGIAAGSVFAISNIKHEPSYYYVDDLQKIVEKNIEEGNEDLMLAAEKVDAANTIEKYYSKLDKKENLDDIYGEIERNATIQPEVVDPSYEEFKESVYRTVDNMENYLQNNIEFNSEEEANNFYNIVYNDYVVINKYLEQNKDQDLSDLLDESVKYKINEILENQEFEQYSYNDYTFEESEKLLELDYVNFNINIDGEKYNIKSTDFNNSLSPDSTSSTKYRLKDILASNYKLDLKKGKIYESYNSSRIMLMTSICLLNTINILINSGKTRR